jgi:subtilisin-like proprotein convertase family protein
MGRSFDKRRFAAVVALVVSAGVLASAPSAGAAVTTFTSATPITIGTGAASNGAPYPSPIAVSGLVSGVTDVDVSLKGFTHTFPDDVGVVLVAPSGAALLLMDGIGEDIDASNVDLTIDDGAAGLLPEGNVAILPGSYRPTAQYTGDSFPAPGPLLVYGQPASKGSATLASTFNGIDPNGAWNLFVRDFSSGDGGSFAGGWALTIATPDPPVVGPPPPPPLLDTALTEAKVKRHARMATFSFAGSGGTGALAFECKLDKAAFAPCSSPRSYKKLKPGKHSFQARAKDATGAVDATPASKEFRIAKPKPKAKPKAAG